jgi:hypothetical protein
MRLSWRPIGHAHAIQSGGDIVMEQMQKGAYSWDISSRAPVARQRSRIIGRASDRRADAASDPGSDFSSAFEKGTLRTP